MRNFSAAGLIDTYRKHIISHVTEMIKDTFRLLTQIEDGSF